MKDYVIITLPAALLSTENIYTMIYEINGYHLKNAKFFIPLFYRKQVKELENQHGVKLFCKAQKTLLSFEVVFSDCFIKTFGNKIIFTDAEIKGRK